jgi:hypothetical protein
MLITRKSNQEVDVAEIEEDGRNHKLLLMICGTNAGLE